MNWRLAPRRARMDRRRREPNRAGVRGASTPRWSTACARACGGVQQLGLHRRRRAVRGAPSLTRPARERSTPPGRTLRRRARKTTRSASSTPAARRADPRASCRATGRMRPVPKSSRVSCRLGGDDRLLAIAPLFHIGARSLASGAHWRGGTVVLQRGFDAQAVHALHIERERITAVHLVPTMVAGDPRRAQLRRRTTCRACAC